MYTLIEPIIAIVIGIYIIMILIGKVKISKDESRSKEWLDRFGPIMKIIAPLIVVIGLIKIIAFFLK